MAERLIFHYHYRDTPLHRLDPRIKLFTLLILTLLIFGTDLAMLPGIALFLAAAAVIARTPLRLYRREMFFFALLALVIFTTRWLGEDELLPAAAAAARFLTVVAGGLLLTDTTAPEELSLAIFRLISPFGKRRAYEFSAKFSLTISFIPLLFDAAAQISEARRSRLDRGMRRPLRRIISLASQMMHLIIDRAEEISFALESRCFTPYVLHGEITWRRADTVGVFIIVSYFAGLFSLSVFVL